VLLRLLGGLLVAVGTTMGCGLVAVSGNHAAGAIAGAFVFTSLAPVGTGIWLWRVARRRDRALAAGGEQAERLRLLDLARKHGGHLTALEVMTLTGMELARAESALDDLCRAGLAEHRVADDGTMVYRVKGLLGAAEKERARSVLDRE
jgi:hypothetical protein